MYPLLRSFQRKYTKNVDSPIEKQNSTITTLSPDPKNKESQVLLEKLEAHQPAILPKEPEACQSQILHKKTHPHPPPLKKTDDPTQASISLTNNHRSKTFKIYLDTDVSHFRKESSRNKLQQISIDNDNESTSSLIQRDIEGCYEQLLEGLNKQKSAGTQSLIYEDDDDDVTEEEEI